MASKCFWFCQWFNFGHCSQMIVVYEFRIPFMHSIWNRLNKTSLKCHKTQTKAAMTLCWRAEVVMLVHCFRDSWSNKLQHARKALFWLHSTPRNITWPVTQTSDLKWDYFTWSSPYTVLNQSWGSNYFFLCFPSLFLTLLSPLHSTSMSHLHYLLAISQRRSIVLCDCIVHPSISSPPFTISLL